MVQTGVFRNYVCGEKNSVVCLDNVNQHHDPRIRNLIENAGGILIFLPRYRWYQHILSHAGLSLMVLTTAWSRHNPFDHSVCVCARARDVHIHTYIHFSLYTYIYIFIYILKCIHTHIFTSLCLSLYKYLTCCKMSSTTCHRARVK